LERARVGAAEFKRRRNPTSKDGRSRVATGGPGLAEADLERLSPHAPTCFRGTGDPSHARVQVTLRAGAGGPPPASLVPAVYSQRANTARGASAGRRGIYSKKKIGDLAVDGGLPLFPAFGIPLGALCSYECPL
jgi:hypothetical protein